MVFLRTGYKGNLNAVRMKFQTFVGICIILALLCEECSSYVSTEESLRTLLFSNYTNDVRPQQTTDVNIQLAPLALTELNIAEQRIAIMGTISMTWADWRLTWTPSNYGNISAISVQPTSIWRPDVIIENAVEDMGVVGVASTDGVKARVFYNGIVAYFPPMKINAACDVKIFNYPFDTQDCDIKVTGWAQPNAEVNITPVTPMTMYYAANGEWDLVETYVGGTDTYSDGAGHFFPRILFTLKFRRKWQFYGMNMVMPILLTSILMCAVFALPIESGEKIGFSITVLLSYIVFLTWVTESLPPVSSDISVLQVYLGLVSCLGTLTILLTIWILHIYHRDDSMKMSSVMKLFVNRVLVPFNSLSFKCIKKKCSRKEDDSDDSKLFDKTISLRIFKVSPGDNAVNGEVYYSDNKEQKPELTSADPETDPSPKENVTWQEVATMLDRFCLYVISGVTLIPSLCILGILYGSY